MSFQSIIQKLILIFILSFMGFGTLHATHNRAGEITYRHISGFTFEATITTYTKQDSPADRPEVIISWGDGTLDTIPRINGGGFGEEVAPNIKKNVYRGIHTYPGPSVYTISFEDPNRNGGVVNIPNSINVPFFVSTQLILNPFLGINNSVQLLNPPIDNACAGQVFIHNAGAFDPDGDSLSYRLVDCRGEGGLPIPGFGIPQATNSFSINPITGDLVWDTPPLNGVGEYNVAFAIDEWRNGQLIGSVVRDMQINVIPCTNQQPPQFSELQNICVLAGDLVQFPVTAISPNNNAVELSANGGPFFFEPPNQAFFPLSSGVSPLTRNFSWQTDCAQVRRQPYQVYFKARDLPFNTAQALVNFRTVLITVIAPPSQMLNASPQGNSIDVSWTPNPCSQAIGYKLYRRVGTSSFIPDTCQTGLPASAGYTQIATINGINNTSFLDSNNGQGLWPGVKYCYRVVAFFADGAESYVSDEICGTLRRDVPIITNVSVEETDEFSGRIFIAWSKPTELDTLQAPGPYIYKIYRNQGFANNDPQLLDSLFNLNDTIYSDQTLGLNTQNFPFNYRIELINNTPGNRFLIGFSQWAASVFVNAEGLDNRIRISWQEQVPWSNESYRVFRFDEQIQQFSQIGETTEAFYVDQGLANGVTYCYKIESVGDYTEDGLVSPILNFSQEVCAEAVDNEPPCPPVLSLNSDCIAGVNDLSWTKPNDFCEEDAVSYRIYFKPNLDAELSLLASINNLADTFFAHIRPNSVAGCYAVTAIDSVGNESEKTVICVDNCPEYELPNVFTPNGDGFNDSFRPFPYRYIESINIQIFNRWGQLMFETNNPEIGWNGQAPDGTLCPDGVYFYICEVNEIRLEGIKKRVLKGNIQIIDSRSGKIN
ncbi:MAG: gliding motility-associated C-terminal domain-containing protein [Flavobacteriales bacterium]